MKFEVGDKVKVIKKRLDFTFPIGTVGLVDAVTKYGVCSVVSGKETWIYNPSDLEPVESGAN